MNQRIIGIVLLVVGIICVAVYGVFFVIFGLMVVFPGSSSRQESFEAVAILDALFSPLVICGAVMMFIGFRLRRRGMEFEAIRANAMSHERVEVTWLSSQMGLDLTRTRKLLLDAISRGIVRGEFASENLFISAMDPREIHNNVISCAGCGATLQSLAVEGGSVVCPYCGTVATPRSATARPIDPRVQNYQAAGRPPVGR